MQKTLITVTRRASTQLAQCVQKDNSYGLLFSCASGGCHGLEYKIEPVQTQPMKTEHQVLDNGINMFICTKSLLYLLGTTVDWSDDMMGARFVFTNPMASSTCGCGATFAPR